MSLEMFEQNSVSLEYRQCLKPWKWMRLFREQDCVCKENKTGDFMPQRVAITRYSLCFILFLCSLLGLGGYSQRNRLGLQVQPPKLEMWCLLILVLGSISSYCRWHLEWYSCFLFSYWRVPRSGKKRSELFKKFYHILEKSKLFLMSGWKNHRENGAVTNITTAWLSKNRINTIQIPSFLYLFFFFQLWEGVEARRRYYAKRKILFLLI